MRQAAHIFRKDLRFLWPQILMVLALTAAFCWSCSTDEARLARGNSTAADYRNTLGFSLLVAWGLLIGSAIHKEHPVGDRQFWVTRPYCWKSLAGAKLLLLLCFISLSFLLSDIVILQSNGVPTAGSARTLLARQLVLCGMIVLPLAALSSMVRNLIQIVLPAPAALVALVFWGNRLHYQSSGQLAWFRGLAVCVVLLAAAAAVFARQYARHGAALSYGILAGAGAIGFTTWVCSPPQTTLLQFLLSNALDPSSGHLVQLAEERTSKLRTPTSECEFAMRIDGLPAGTEARADLVRAQIAGRSFSWRSNWEVGCDQMPNRPGMDWSQWHDGQICVSLDPQLARETNGQPVDVTFTVAMTLYHTEATARILPGESQLVPRVGTCSIGSMGTPSETINCSTSVDSSVGIRLATGPALLQASTPEIFAVSPVAIRSLQVPLSGITGRPFETSLSIEAERPIVRLQRSLHIRRVKLGTQ